MPLSWWEVLGEYPGGNLGVSPGRIPPRESPDTRLLIIQEVRSVHGQKPSTMTKLMIGDGQGKSEEGFVTNGPGFWESRGGQ